jgi:hypothetical protein
MLKQVPEGIYLGRLSDTVLVPDDFDINISYGCGADFYEISCYLRHSFSLPWPLQRNNAKLPSERCCVLYLCLLGHYYRTLGHYESNTVSHLDGAVIVELDQALCEIRRELGVHVCAW